MLHVPDTDATLERARDRGAEVQREPYENYGSRNATIVDPFGHRWMLSGPTTGAAMPIQHGDVGYVSVWTPDADRAAAFYGHVLGWTYDPVTHRVTNTKQRIGLFASPVRTPCSAAMRSPTSTAPGSRSWPAAERSTRSRVRLRRSARRDRCAGDGFARVPASRRSATARSQRRWARRTFVHHPRGHRLGGVQGVLRRVLFWTFEPGRIDDGWAGAVCPSHVRHRRRQPQQVTVPMWTVADVEAAVARVREAGGTVIEEPSQQAYGTSAQCMDDQGTRFYLGEF